MMGPPGAGKGTQARFVASHFRIPAISTGDIFRRNVSEGTALGVQAKQHMDLGEYVPDDLTNRMVHDRISQPDTGPGFVLDGYPRTLQQVDELDRMIETKRKQLDAVVVLSVDPEETVHRVLRRAETEGRADDTAEVVRRRHQVYTEQTAPLIELYERRGLVRIIDGTGDVHEISARIARAWSAPVVTAMESQRR